VVYVTNSFKREGKKAEAGKTVSAHTDNFLTEKFLIVHIQKKPIEFPLGQGNVIEGWDEGIALLRVGDKARL
jgi:peptidyl-prolyl cis-trans isomerase A (cyclophilin A)